MKKQLVNFINKPKKVAIICLVIAVTVGTFGYIKINKKVSSSYDETNTDRSTGNFSNLTLGFLSSGRIKDVLVKAGETVEKGQILATLDAVNVLGSLTQARAAYSTANANYDKITNGATETTLNIAKASVHTAEVNLEGTTKQQEVLVKNAYKNLLNSTIEAIPSGIINDYVAPTISGSYDKDIDGQINISVYYTGNGQSYSVSGITNGSGVVATTNAQPIGDSGLYIKFPNNSTTNYTNWIINIPNKKASNYLSNYNAYQLALENQNQAVKNSQAALDQANTSLSSLTANARPEDMAIAKAQVSNALGALEIAESAYNNTIIKAPSDGVVTAVSIIAGQIALTNAPAIEFLSK